MILKYDDHISITKEDCIASAILAKPYAKDPLIDAFRLFDAKRSLIEYLLEPGNVEKKHVAGVSWLFSLIGFTVIPLALGNFDNRKDEKIPQTQPEYSSDILLSDGVRIFVLDCTSSLPPRDKITRIRNTAGYIKKEIKKESHNNVEVIPVIISSQDCSGSKQEDAKSSHVALIDKNHIKDLHGLLLDGLKAEAMKLFDDIAMSYLQ
jgi:hypothetical protein